MPHSLSRTLLSAEGQAGRSLLIAGCMGKEEHACDANSNQAAQQSVLLLVTGAWGRVSPTGDEQTAGLRGTK